MASSHPLHPPFPQADRQAWLATLANAPREILRERAEACGLFDDRHRFEWLREPEVGLTMVRARIGNSGDRFNVGEVALTRCVVRHRSGAGATTIGVGYVKGRDADQARSIAMFDALLQDIDEHDALMRDAIAPLRGAVDARRADEASRTAASRVRFYTMQPEVS